MFTVGDFWIDMGITVLLRLLRDKTESAKWKRALLKLFTAIADRFPDDKEFLDVRFGKRAGNL